MNDGNLSVPKAVSLVDKTVKNMQPVLCGISCKNQYTERWQAMLNTQHSIQWWTILFWSQNLSALLQCWLPKAFKHS